MKKIVIIFLLCAIRLLSFAQPTNYPVTQNIGSPTTLLNVGTGTGNTNGGGALKVWGGFIPAIYPDTVDANLISIINYPGAEITTGNGDSTWQRFNNKWNLISVATVPFGYIPNITQVLTSGNDAGFNGISNLGYVQTQNGSELGNGFLSLTSNGTSIMQLSADSVSAGSFLQAPNANGVIPLFVNGIGCNASGNIPLPNITTVTTTGTSGPATLSASGDTINVPNYVGVSASKICILGNSILGSYACHNAFTYYAMTGADSAIGTTMTNDATPGYTIQQIMAVYLADPNKSTYGYVVLEGMYNNIDSAGTGSLPIQDSIKAKCGYLQNCIDSVIKYSPNAIITLVAMHHCKSRWATIFPTTSGTAKAYLEQLAIDSAMEGLGSNRIVRVNYRVFKNINILEDGAGNLASMYNCGDNIHQDSIGMIVAYVNPIREQLIAEGALQSTTRPYEAVNSGLLGSIPYYSGPVSLTAQTNFNFNPTTDIMAAKGFSINGNNTSGTGLYNNGSNAPSLEYASVKCYTTFSGAAANGTILNDYENGLGFGSVAAATGDAFFSYYPVKITPSGNNTINVTNQMEVYSYAGNTSSFTSGNYYARRDSIGTISNIANGVQPYFSNFMGAKTGYGAYQEYATANNFYAGKVIVGSTNSTDTATSTVQIKGSFSTNYKAIASSYSATINDYTLDCSGTFTVTLPTAVGIVGRIYLITNSGAGVITIATTSSQIFTNVATSPTSLVLSSVGSYLVQSTGSNWIAK